MGGVGEQGRGRRARTGVRRLDQPGRPRRAQEVGDVELPRRRIAAHTPAQIGCVVGGQFPGHQGGGARVHPQRHHRLARIAAGNAEASVRARLDEVGIARVAVARAVLLQRGEPGLLGELVEAGGR